MHTTLARDNFGKMIAQWLKKEKVKLDVVKTEKGGSPSAVVIVEEPTGNRSGFYNLGGIAKLNLHDLGKIKFRLRSKFLLLDRHNPTCTRALITKAKRQGLTTLLDLGDYQKGSINLAKAADVVFISGQDRAEPALKLLRSGPKICVLTQGEKGCLIASDGKVFRQKAIRIKAVDTNGAGDIFMGAFTYGLIKNWSLSKTAAFASAAAADSCGHFGKFPL